MTKFTKIAGVDVYVEEAAPLIEDGLKCTVTRKACLLLLEYVTSIIVRESKSHLSVQCELPYSAKFSRGLIFADFVGLQSYTKF